MFKKNIQSDAPIIIGDTPKTAKMFPPGFSYRIGGLIYTVKKDVTKEVSSPMREVLVSDGKVEIIPIESIAKDIREPDSTVLDDGLPKKEVAVKKVAKKKVKKKKNN